MPITGNTYRSGGCRGIFSGIEGSIAIFLSFTVAALSLAVFGSAAYLTERKRTEKRYLDISAALSSLLADYDAKLYEDYGLTVSGYPDAGQLRREFNRLLLKNDFPDIENAHISFSGSLGDPGALEEMITEHMGPRMAVRIARGIADRFGILSRLDSFRELLEIKSAVEELIFDFEKTCAYILSDIGDINRVDLEKALAGDTAYLVYKLDEMRRFADSVKSLCDSALRLETYRTRIAKEGSLLDSLLERISVFSGAVVKLGEAAGKAGTNILLLEECLELAEGGLDISGLVSELVHIDIDLASLLPGSVSGAVAALDLRNVSRGFFDEALLRAVREDKTLPEGMEKLLPYVTEAPDILGSLSSFKDLFSADPFGGFFEKLYSQAMLNEYILDKFSYETANREQRFFVNEVEYILHGKSSQNENLRKTRLNILLLRTALNYISIHLDSEKTALARTVGAAVTAFAFGAGAGIAGELVIVSWAVYEAYEDLDRLLAGEQIAVLKADGDFSLDLGSPGGVKSPVKAGYDDYLRLFLVFCPDDVKLGRIGNLISLNTGLSPNMLYIRLKGGYKDGFSLEKGY